MKALYDSKSITLNDRGMKELFGQKAKIEVWLEIEAALARAQGKLGIIPQEAADNIVKNCIIENIDFDEMEKILKEIGHNFVPFLKLLVKSCSKEGGKYVHYGVTTQNIQQTGQLLIMKRYNSKLIASLEKIIGNLKEIARKHKHTILPGRTHGKHALPITFGYKVCVWIVELEEVLNIIKDSEKRIFQVMMGGAVGAYHALGEKGVDVQNMVAAELGMTSMIIPSRSIRLNRLEYLTNLSLLGTILNKIGEEIYRTSSEEFDEVTEAFKKGTVGSSTMPQKVNPKLAKGIIANTQKIFSVLNSSLYASTKPFEADSSSYMLMDNNIQESLELMCEAIIRMEALSKELVVNPQSMKKNVGLTYGLINSEKLMMKLAGVIGKDAAHSLVYEIAMNTLEYDITYEKALKENMQINSLFTEEEIQKLIDPKEYIGLCAEIVDKITKE